MTLRTVDEREPLLRASDLSNDLHKTISISKVEEVGDYENPQKWPSSFKWLVTSLLFFMAFTVTFNCISPMPIASRIIEDLNDGQPNRYATVLLVTIWEFGEAAGPLVIAPLSEMYGRYPVINICSVLFVMATALGAVAQTAPVMIVSRALSGLVVTSNVLGPAIVGDIFEPEQRGSPMSLVMLAPLIGGSIGPALSGYIAESLHWRWVVWMNVVLTSSCAVLFIICLKETYHAAIIKKKERLLHKASRQATRLEANDEVVEIKSESQNGLMESIVRPAAILSSSGILVALALPGAIAYAHYYNITTTMPDILQNIYGLSAPQIGASLFSFSIGSIASVMLCNLTLDKIYASMKAANGGIGLPEFRLPICIFGALALPLTIALYGWAAELQLPLSMVLTSVGLIGMAMLAVEIPLAAYIVDAFGDYSASAMTGLVVIRCLAGTFLPLGAAPLIDTFSYGWGFTILSLITLALAPIPILVMQHGHEWRQRSVYTRLEPDQ
ncbi:unnamed protein product [Clonostachys solani]|uniref:Major facilitator superfamily (MFS) profile domain-containing protein n=1 Tax=Clonostachys solani TaxID=160281 RepID=A0A9N9Z7L3_9HYPO|nr:unnamed protein product [Clonostachys solani]